MLENLLSTLSESILIVAALFILAGSLYLTFRLRFVQLRLFPQLFRMLRSSYTDRSRKESRHTIPPHRALFAAMSTTLGISTIVGPTIAISLGGPGALVGFLLTAFFGSAATYAEVSLSVQHRKKLESGTIMGGPMQYLRQILSPKWAAWYASSCLILMMAWSGAQANQLAAILDSPLLGDYRVPTILSGGCIALLVLFVLMGGIRWIGALSSKMVPMMFLLFIGSSLWIVGTNVDKLGIVFGQIFTSAFSPTVFASGVAIGGLTNALRWGMLKGIQTTEAGIGTQTMPHSMAETRDPIAQGALAMLSTYTAGFVAFLSGCVTLITGTWLDPSLPLGVTMVATSFQLYFSTFGILIVAMSTLLFGFGTILGNSYNGSQCFNYLTDNRKTRTYFLGIALMIFVGAIAEVKTFWSLIDLVLVGVALPHMYALIKQAYQRPDTILKDQALEPVGDALTIHRQE